MKLTGGYFMKRILAILFISLYFTVEIAFAENSAEALKFFRNYVNAANSYSDTLIDMYSPDAKIIRQVIKPDGELVDVETDTQTYVKQLRMGQMTARFRRYKNTYSNIKAEKVSNGYKISALRQPSGEKYKLKSYMILKKQPDGKLKIVEELMQTKVQLFLKYANK